MALPPLDALLPVSQVLCSICLLFCDVTRGILYLPLSCRSSFYLTRKYQGLNLQKETHQTGFISSVDLDSFFY